jgi:nucleolar protein 14
VFKVSTDLGEQSCAALWGRTVKILHAQLQKRLRDYAQGQRAHSCWPSLGRLLMLQLLGRVFSVTDVRNDVVGPATLFLCQCLSQCPVSGIEDLASGLLAASVVSSYHAQAKRYVPEVVGFIHTVLSLYLPSLTAPTRPAQNFQGTFNLTHLAPVRAQVASAKAAPNDAKVQWFAFSSKAHSGREGLAAAGILNTAYSMFDNLVTAFESTSALPEIAGPVLTTLRNLRPQSKPHALPTWLQQRHLAVVERAIAATEKVRGTRQSLQWRKASVTSIETKAPRFQLDYTFKKDVDPDADRAKVKQLTRQLKREKKAAMRELRRDSDFIDQERYKEQQAAKDFRRAERVKNFGFMEEQQATINLQVRKGNGLMKGGGSGVVKKARIKRL